MSNKKPSKRYERLRKLSPIAFDLSLIPYEIHCGKHSGFPDCCIKFYITKWKWIWDNSNSKYRKRYWKRMANLTIGYIPCPDCLKKKNFIEVKKCPKNCRLKKLISGK